MKNDKTYESEHEVDTLGDSDMSELNSDMEEEGKSSEETKRTSEDKHENLTERDIVKEL